MQKHLETLEEAATHTTDEARMLLPGVQAILGFQLVAVTNARFTVLTSAEQLVFLAAFVLLAVAMGLLMAPAAYHRQVERGRVTRRFIDLSSTLLAIALVPLITAFSIDTYLVARIILENRAMAGAVAVIVAAILAGLWYAMPAVCRRLKT
ncbi:MAG: hypothetical protein JOY64_02535 [Alphaproteobacteria bacterium]|nr:hypothetical protein [Alphaproteobacteria bacterium]MBV8406480.1 hypothetical protein [Alphaproteobacteria bacterium]